MAATDVSICSNALLMLGAQPINALTEENDRARLASNLYETTRDSLLRSHPWNCLIQRVQLAPDSTTPAFDWAYQYTLPEDFLKALAVGELGFEVEFRIEGLKLLCDDNPANLRYVAKVANPAKWDAMLIEGMELAMAAKMAYGITQSTSKEQAAEQKLALFMKRARAVDGQDDTGETLGDSPLLSSRFRSSIGGSWRG